MSINLVKFLQKKAKKFMLSIDSIIRITPGGRHAWVNSNVGVIRKPLSELSASLIEKFHVSNQA